MASRSIKPRANPASLAVSAVFAVLLVANCSEQPAPSYGAPSTVLGALSGSERCCPSPPTLDSPCDVTPVPSRATWRLATAAAVLAGLAAAAVSTRTAPETYPVADTAATNATRCPGRNGTGAQAVPSQ